MSKVNIDKEHEPKTAVFWAKFATEVGKQKKHCPMVTLYENREGEFFAVEQAPGALPMTYELIKDPKKWLDDCVEWLKLNAISDRLT